jgi:hypothetical protein
VYIFNAISAKVKTPEELFQPEGKWNPLEGGSDVSGVDTLRRQRLQTL